MSAQLSFPVLPLWQEALRSVDPAARIQDLMHGNPRWKPEAWIFWGKASRSGWGALQQFRESAPARQKLPGSSFNTPILVISPDPAPVPRERLGSTWWIQAEHPLPGPGSFRAGAALIEFIESLSRLGISRLQIELSGGASSLAWLKPARLSAERLQQELQDLYRSSLSIQELNRRRAQLCALKAGGAARWLRNFAPKTQARVGVLSDVYPYGPEVVGSGPFWDGKLPHTVWGDLGTALHAARSAALHRNWPVLECLALEPRAVEAWATQLSDQVQKHQARGSPGVLIYGGEPKLRLPELRAPVRGGRQTHLAGLLALELLSRHRVGAVPSIELLCASTDGVDGISGGAGAKIDVQLFRRLAQSPGLRRELAQSLRRFDSAAFWERHGALLPLQATGTNVQDLVLIGLGASPAPRN